MISLLTGKIGAGKTLHAVEMIYDALLEGRTVATNIELCYAKLAILAVKEKGLLIQPEQIIQLDLNDAPNWHEMIPWGVVGFPTLVVLDEVHLFFNSRDFAKTDKLHRAMLSFLSQSRKACVDVVFVAQVAGQVEKQFRAQAKFEVRISNFGNYYLPIFGKIPIEQNVMTTIDLDNSQTMRKQRRDYPKKMFGCYNTLAMLDDQMRDALDGMVRQEPIKLIKIKSSEKSDMINKLNNKNEILDNTNNNNAPRRFWNFFRFSGNNGKKSKEGPGGAERKESPDQAI